MSDRRRGTWMLLIPLVVAAVACPTRGGEIEAILSGVTTVAAPGLPGTICALSPDVLVILDGPAGQGVRQPVVAAVRCGRGAAVVFGHDAYFRPDTLALADTGRLMLNLIRWANPKPRVAVVALPGLADHLKAKAIDAVAAPDLESGLMAEANALFLPPGTPRDDAEVTAIRRFVEGGGAVFAAHTGWGWAQVNPGKSLALDFPLNRLLGPMGLAVGDGQIEKDKRDGLLHVANNGAAPSPILRADAALDLLIKIDGKEAQLIKDTNGDAAQAAATVMYAARVAPAESELMRRLRELAADRAYASLPSPARPLRPADALARVVLTMQVGESARTPADQLKPHPAATFFPGEVPPDAPRVTKTVDVHLRVPRWHSTGLYAAPGEPVTVTVPPDAVARGLNVRIGPHTDRTYHLALWHRAPEISRLFKITAETTKIANPFGGLIYVDVPQGRADETIAVRIAGAVEAPLFVLGKTTVADWRDAVRKRPAPWAEIGTGKLILTLKSEAIRDLDDPTPVLEHWDRIMDACATLAAWPLARRSPERIVADADISAGYMHSGYPIMTGLDVTRTFVDLDKLKTADGGWGFYHEIGHNHQNPDWTFAGTTEVTVNLFTMYALETVCGVSKEESTRRALADPAQRIKRYLARPDFETWKADPFLALAMYAQLRLEFGWEPYKQVFADYRRLPARERPRTDDDKRDQWLIRMSKATGHNLGPFFQAWGIPTTDAARRSISNLPEWLPRDMKK